jgi:hypothetical protein
MSLENFITSEFPATIPTSKLHIVSAGNLSASMAVFKREDDINFYGVQILTSEIDIQSNYLTY